MGVYLGPSPGHSRSVHLIISLFTGLVLLQFHVQFDDLFETLKNESRIKKVVPNWQQKAGLFSKTST